MSSRIMKWCVFQSLEVGTPSQVLEPFWGSLVVTRTTRGCKKWCHGSDIATPDMGQSQVSQMWRSTSPALSSSSSLPFQIYLEEPVCKIPEKCDFPTNHCKARASEAGEKEEMDINLASDMNRSNQIPWYSVVHPFNNLFIELSINILPAVCKVICFSFQKIKNT